MQAGSPERVDRRLAAILAADVVGYSRLMGQDELGTLGRLHAHRRELTDPKIAEHKGRIVKTTGDGLLVEFPSVVEAVACAAAVQRGMSERNASIPEDQRIEFRIGINLGDVIVEDGDIHGDGVNVAARLEALAEPSGICVSAVVHEQVRDRLDLAFDDLGEQQVKNIARPLHVYRILLAEGPPASAEPPRAPALPDKPSIAVLPFQNLSGDPEQDYFVDGMVEEIITALSRIRWLFVIARNSSFSYKGQPPDVRLVGRELGVRYVLEGSVRKAGNRVRITGQLIDTATGVHLWADRFDGSLEDIFELQDTVASSVAGVIEPALQAAETARSVNRPTRDLTAYDLYLRAHQIYSQLSQGGIIKALDLLNQAIGRDPQYGPALSAAARCHLRLYLDDCTVDPDLELRHAGELARKALEVAPDDPVTISVSAYVLAELGEDIETMVQIIDRARALNPSYAHAWFYSGAIRVHAGLFTEAITHVETCLRLSPRYRFGSHYTVIGAAHFFAGRFDEAESSLRLALREHPNHPWPYRLLAASYAHSGRLGDAREVLRQLRTFTLMPIPDRVPWHTVPQHQLLLSGLRLAAREES